LRRPQDYYFSGVLMVIL